MSLLYCTDCREDCPILELVYKIWMMAKLKYWKANDWLRQALIGGDSLPSLEMCSSSLAIKTNCHDAKLLTDLQMTLFAELV